MCHNQCLQLQCAFIFNHQSTTLIVDCCILKSESEVVSTLRDFNMCPSTSVSLYRCVMLIMDRLLLMMVRSLMTTLITNTHLTDTQRVFLSDLYTTIICCLLVSIQHALCLGKSVRIHILYNILTSICQQYLSKRFH